MTYDEYIADVQFVMSFFIHEKGTKHETNRINQIEYEKEPSEENANCNTLAYTTPTSSVQFFLVPV